MTDYDWDWWDQNRASLKERSDSDGRRGDMVSSIKTHRDPGSYLAVAQLCVGDTVIVEAVGEQNGDAGLAAMFNLLAKLGEEVVRKRLEGIADAKTTRQANDRVRRDHGDPDAT